MSRPCSRSRAALGALLICAAMLPLLSGCTWFNRVLHRGGKNFTGCTERPFAGNADSRPPLKVPEGMSAPDTRGAVKIPEVGPQARDRPKTEPCLAQPPNFFAKPLPTTEPAKGKRERERGTPPASLPAAPPAPAAPASPPAPAPAPAPAAPSPPPAPPAPAEEAPVPPG